MSFLPCELHCHTVHSDGDFTVNQLQQKAVDDHLAVIALTDHNTTAGYSEIDDSILPVIRGIEWTTYYGHMLVMGADKYVDWRDATPDNIDEKIRQVKEVGGIVGIAHPFQMGSPVCTGGRWQFNVKDWRNVDYMEIWHDKFGDENTENDKAVKLWTSLLDKGYHIGASYGRDWHRDGDGHYGCTYLNIEGDVTPQNAMRALRLGKSVVSTGAKFFFRVHQWGNTYYLGDTIRKGLTVFSFFGDYHSREKNVGDHEVVYKTIKIITNSNRCVLETMATERHVRITAERGHWYRAELWGEVDGKKSILAITSPVYAE